MSIINCLNCQKEFEDHNKSKNNKTRKFCNMRCYNEYKKINQIELICNFCKKSFFVSIARATQVKHCSRTCYENYANSNGNRICNKCGKMKDEKEYAFYGPKKLKRRLCIDCFNQRTAEKCKLPHVRWKTSKDRCAKIGQTWDILLENFEKLISMCCHYCHGELNKTGCGLDRKNNDLGYTLENVVPCCRICNLVKNYFFTYEDMLLLSPTLIQIRKNK